MAKKVKKTKKTKKKAKPITNGKSGRNNKGQFASGNSLSVGHSNSNCRRSKDLKGALIEAVSEEDIKAIAKKLVEKAKTGDVPAIKELFDRLWGRAKQEIEGTLNIRDADETPLTEEELLNRLQKAKAAGNGIDTKSIEGSNGV